MINLFGAPGAFHQSVPDFKPHHLKIASHRVIPKPQDFDALLRQKTVAGFILRPLIREAVSTAIEFHSKFRFDTKEIEEVDAARVLPAEFEFLEATIPKQTPQTFFHIGRFLAQVSGKIARGSGARTPGTPHPIPLPSEGRGSSA